MDRERLAQAYCATSYCAQLPSGELCLRIGMPTATLDAILTQQQVDTWAFVTSDNPRSEVRPEGINQHDRQHLAAQVRAGGCAAAPCIARSDRGDWPPEHGLLIFGIDPDDALSLARAFGQHAILAGRRGGPPVLIFCE